MACSPAGGRQHQLLYLLLRWQRIAISAREALAYLAIGVSAALLFLLAIMMLLQNSDRSAGHVYAVMTYLWNFVSSLAEGPGLADQLTQLRDIGQRVDATTADQATN